MDEKINQLIEELNNEEYKEEQSLTTAKSFPSNIHIENILIGLLFLFLINNKKDSLLTKLNKDPKELYGHISKTNYLIRDIMPYFGDDARSALSGMEALLNIAENVYNMKSGIYKERAKSMGTVNTPKKPIKLLQTAAPYLPNTGKENVNKFLDINNRIERLQNPQDRNLLRNGQEILELLDLLNVPQAKKIKGNIDTIKTFASMLQ